jgi:hypothetical protein
MLARRAVGRVMTKGWSGRRRNIQTTTIRRHNGYKKQEDIFDGKIKLHDAGRYPGRRQHKNLSIQQPGDNIP